MINLNLANNVETGTHQTKIHFTEVETVRGYLTYNINTRP